LPLGLSVNKNLGANVKNELPLTINPNVGGFGQAETEIIMQNPLRVKGMICFFIAISVGQTLLVLKKKQFEKVQVAELNF
jgi:apocytochrome f